MRDLQARLSRLGFDSTDPPATFGTATVTAVRQFQQGRGLVVDGICGPQTWAALVEAGFTLGDRLLYLRQPMLRGDDVADLQRRLGALGFDAGRVDGIFGPHSARALEDFQRNVGLTTDGICGPDTLAALRRLGARPAGAVSVARLREEEGLRGGPRGLAHRRIVISQAGGLDAVADVVRRALHERGALVAILLHQDPSRRAEEANRFGADAVIDLAAAVGERPTVAYYSTDGFESVGGCRLARLIAAELTPVLGPVQDRGMRLPVLRETRMPAVCCQLGPADAVVRRGEAIAAALERAISRWADTPVDT